MNTIAPKTYSFIGFPRNVTSDAPLKGNTDIVFCLTDSIFSRGESFIATLVSKKIGNYQTKYFVEAGTHRSVGKLYIVDLDNLEEVNTYYGILMDRYTNETNVNEVLPCTERSTYFYATYLCSIIAQKIVKLLDKTPVKTFETWVDMGNLFIEEFGISNNDVPKTLSSIEYIINDWWEIIGANVDLWEDITFNFNNVQLSVLTLETAKQLFLKVYTTNNFLTTTAGNLIRYLPITPFLDESGIAVRSNGKLIGTNDTNCDFCVCSYCQVRGDCRVRACSSHNDSRRCAEGSKTGRFVWCQKPERHEIDNNSHLCFEMFRHLKDMEQITNQDVLFCEAAFFSNWIGETIE